MLLFFSVSKTCGIFQDTTELLRGIYCKTIVLSKAIANAANVNHLVRRLFLGIFIASKVQDCTLSGQTWHAGGKDHLQKSQKPLHSEAVKVLAGMLQILILVRRKFHTSIPNIIWQIFFWCCFRIDPDFANGIAKKKRWPTRKMDKLRHVISQRLTEVKKDFTAGKIKDF